MWNFVLSGLGNRRQSEIAYLHVKHPFLDRAGLFTGRISGRLLASGVLSDILFASCIAFAVFLGYLNGSVGGRKRAYFFFLSFSLLASSLNARSSKSLDGKKDSPTLSTLRCRGKIVASAVFIAQLRFAAFHTTLQVHYFVRVVPMFFGSPPIVHHQNMEYGQNQESRLHKSGRRYAGRGEGMWSCVEHENVAFHHLATLGNRKLVVY